MDVVLTVRLQLLVAGFGPGGYVVMSLRMYIISLYYLLQTNISHGSATLTMLRNQNVIDVTTIKREGFTPKSWVLWKGDKPCHEIGQK